MSKENLPNIWIFFHFTCSPLVFSPPPSSSFVLGMAQHTAKQNQKGPKTKKAFINLTTDDNKDLFSPKKIDKRLFLIYRISFFENEGVFPTPSFFVSFYKGIHPPPPQSHPFVLFCSF